MKNANKKYKRYPDYKPSGVEWLGEVPPEWQVQKLKYFTRIIPSNIDKKTRDGEKRILLCNYTDVYYNEIISTDIQFMAATAKNGQINKFALKKGDVLITKDSEDPNDIAVPAYVIENLEDVLCGYHLAIIRPVNSKAGNFLYYFFKSIYARSTAAVNANGLTRYALGTYPIKNIVSVLPPTREQVVIATFLDRETGKIDRMVERQGRMIELLQEKRQAVISHAVTKGLDPDAPMKDSGVEWLGEIPEGWTKIAIKWASPVSRGASPRPIDAPKYFNDEGEFAWVRIADVTAAGRYLEKTTQRLSQLGSSLSVKLNPGDLFLSIAGSVGKPCITKIKCCIHDGFVYFPTWEEDIDFLYYIFASGAPYQGLGKMGTQLNLNTDTVGGIVIGLPPRCEQEQISKYLDIETAKIDQLIEKAKEAIELMKERRTALISAAVTGKIDVRDAVEYEVGDSGELMAAEDGGKYAADL